MFESNNIFFDVNCMFSSVFFKKIIKGNKCISFFYFGIKFKKRKKIYLYYNVNIL